MKTSLKVFLDTSALFAGIWSHAGGARLILKLGEAGAVQLLISPQVVSELERALRAKAPGTLGVLALLLDRSGVEVTAPPGADILQRARSLIGHAGDAAVLAAAWTAGADYFVTLDRKHFLDNRRLARAAPLPMGTPGDCLAWLRGRLLS